MDSYVAFNIKHESSVWKVHTTPLFTSLTFLFLLNNKLKKNSMAVISVKQSHLPDVDSRLLVSSHVHMSEARTRMFLLKCGLPLKSGCISLEVASNFIYWNKKIN